VTAPLKDIGALNRRLVLEAPDETGDGAGGVTRSYITAAMMWAHIAPLSARADVAAESLGAVLNHRIVIRRRAGLDARHRFRDGARVYRIIAVRETVDRRFLEIDAEEREE
jgi:SPP1 family predicted phage head-tail adaptor